MNKTERLYVDIGLTSSLLKHADDTEIANVTRAIISYVLDEPFSYDELSPKEEIMFQLLKDVHDSGVKEREARCLQNRKNALSRYGSDNDVGLRTSGKRKAIPKKIRFAVLERDGHTCQYCGRKAPEVTLEIDHIKPVCDGGTNDIENLITSCVECNLGKGGRYGEDY